MNNLTTYLPRATAVAGVILGVFLILGGYGHLQGIADQMAANGQPAGNASLAIWAAGGILLLPGICNVLASPWIWLGKGWAVKLAGGVTLAAFAYLAWLLVKGVPDHPIALFTGLVAAYLLLLLVTMMRGRDSGV